jgi:hypothetical protein
MKTGKQLRDEAIQGLIDTMDAAWAASVRNAIQNMAVIGMPFTSEDVLELAGPCPGEPRALGALMQAAGRAGQIKPTDKFVTAKRPSRHAGTVRVWEPAEKEMVAE